MGGSAPPYLRRPEFGPCFPARMLRPPLPRRAAVLGLALLVLPFAAGCDTGSSDEIVEGVNFTRLFAPPTAAERAAVEADWAARTYEARNAQVVAEQTVGGARVVIVSHTMTDAGGDDFTHYGVIRIPEGAADFPVLVYHHGGDDGFSLAGEQATLGLFPTLAAQTVQVLPVYRSEAITDAFGPGTTYQAGGSPSPWDRDVDDAIALLNVALQLFPAETDGGRIGAMGVSRGGNVALLMALRDARVRVVTDYFGPADFFDASIEQLAAAALLGVPSVLDLPGARYLLENVLEPLQKPGADYDAARLEILRRSAAYFTADLPNLQVHHHRDDPTVPFAQSASLDAHRQAAPNQGAYDFNAYDNALPGGVSSAHDIRAMPPSTADTEQFMNEHLLAPSLVPAFTGFGD